VDDAAFSISRDPAERPLHPHPDLHFIGSAYNLCGHPRPFIELNNRQNVRGKMLELLACCVDNGMRNNGAGTGKFVVGNLPAPATVRAERTWREKVPAACFTFRA